MRRSWYTQWFGMRISGSKWLTTVMPTPANPGSLGEVNYQQLKKREILLQGKEITTAVFKLPEGQEMHRS